MEAYSLCLPHFLRQKVTVYKVWHWTYSNERLSEKSVINKRSRFGKRRLLVNRSREKRTIRGRSIPSVLGKRVGLTSCGVIFSPFCLSCCARDKIEKNNWKPLLYRTTFTLDEHFFTCRCWQSDRVTGLLKVPTQGSREYYVQTCRLWETLEGTEENNYSQ